MKVTPHHKLSAIEGQTRGHAGCCWALMDSLVAPDFFGRVDKTRAVYTQVLTNSTTAI